MLFICILTIFFWKTRPGHITPIPNQNNHGRFNKQYLSFFRDSPCVSIQDLRENLFRGNFENSKTQTQSGSSKSMMGSSDSVRTISQWLVCIIKNFVCQTFHRRVVTFYPITKNWPNKKKILQIIFYWW